MIFFGWLLKWFFWINLIVVMYKFFVSCIVSEVGVDLDNIIFILILVVLIKILDEIWLLKIKILFFIGICCWI